jgi:hypothetical protein
LLHELYHDPDIALEDRDQVEAFIEMLTAQLRMGEA